MKPRMDVAVIENYDVESIGVKDPEYLFVTDLRVAPRDGGQFEVNYMYGEDGGGTYFTLLKDGDRAFTGIRSSGKVLHVRPPRPEDAIIMASRAGVAQPLEVVNEHIAEGGGMLASDLEAVVDPANIVLAVVLRTGLGVYFRENGVWQLKRIDPRLVEDTTMQVLAPNALEYWDDADEPVSITDLPYMVDGMYVDPGEDDTDWQADEKPPIPPRKGR